MNIHFSTLRMQIFSNLFIWSIRDILWAVRSQIWENHLTCMFWNYPDNKNKYLILTLFNCSVSSSNNGVPWSRIISRSEILVLMKEFPSHPITQTLSSAVSEVFNRSARLIQIVRVEHREFPKGVIYRCWPHSGLRLRCSAMLLDLSLYLSREDHGAVTLLSQG